MRRDDACEVKLPSNKEMISTMEVLRRGVHHHAESFQKWYECEKFIISSMLEKKNKRQTTIGDYFQTEIIYSHIIEYSIIK